MTIPNVTNSVKLTAMLLVLSLSLIAQSNPRRLSTVSPPTLTYEWVAPDCTGIDGAFNQISSGCPFYKLKVTARSSNANVAGFYILVKFHDTIDNYRTATTFTQERDGSFTATFILGDPKMVVLQGISARELIDGQTVTI